MRFRGIKRICAGLLSTAMIMSAFTLTGCSGKSGLTGKTSQEIVAEMGAGFNIGNSMDASGAVNPVYQETSWGNARISQELLDALKEKGFTTVRIPCTWYEALSDDGSYTINADFLARVKEIVDYAYKDGFYIILNTMHEDFTENPKLTVDYVSIGEELSAVWEQIANEFADYDEHLIFESMNEPRITNSGNEWNGSKDGCAAVNYLNQVFVNTIRLNGKGYNDERCLMVPGYAASSNTSCLRGISLPTYNGEVCNNLIVSVHSYTPYNFCLSDSDSTFDEADEQAIDAVYEDIKTFFLDYGVAVVMGETGATNTSNNTAERVKWAQYFASTSASYGVPVCLWDNGNNAASGGECHSYIDRQTAEWVSEYETIADTFVSAYKNAEWQSALKESADTTESAKEITYIANGGIWATSKSFPESPSYDNLTFDGWYLTPDYQEDSKLDITKVSGAVTAYAKYELNLETAGLADVE